MTKTGTGGGRKRHPVVITLWLLAAAAVAAGFAMRILAHFWIGWGLRFLGVEFIAGGLVLAALAWLAERWTGMKPPPD